MKKNVKYSIIIPVRKINNYLKENISHLKNLSFKEFEVLIITDKQEKFEFNDNRFRIIPSNTSNPAVKRNLGASMANGEILVFLDDDAYPSADWLTQADKIFDNPRIYALGGPAVTPLDAGFPEKMSGRVLESWLSGADTTYRYVPSSKREINDYPSVNLFVRKKSFDRVGGFIINYWPGEDTKLCLDLIKLHNKPFLYHPLPVVFHHRRSLFLPFLKQISRYGRHRGQFARIFPQNSRLPKFFVPSLFVLGFVVGPAAAAVSEFLAKMYLYVIILYIFLLGVESTKAFLKEKDLRTFLYLPAGIFLTHIVYGVNFIVGLIKKPRLEYRSVDKKTGSYLGG